MEITVPFLKESTGLGDLVKSVTSAVGIAPCSPCEERRRLLNQTLKLVPRAQQWTTPEDDPPEGWSLQQEVTQPSTVAHLRWYRHTDGKQLIWKIVDGKYKHSYAFCCGENSEALVLAKWEELTRA